MEDETLVIFRKYKREHKVHPESDEVELLALFPEIEADHDGNCLCYEFVGQHSSGYYPRCIDITEPAHEDEYRSLKDHLERDIGYKLKVRKKYVRKYA